MSTEWSPESAAANGAVWLDEIRPDWWRQIDADRLELGDGCRCVLGQLHGNYDDGVATLDLGNGPPLMLGSDDWNPEARVCRLGFFDPVDEECDWVALTAAWRTEISARRARHIVQTTSPMGRAIDGDPPRLSRDSDVGAWRDRANADANEAAELRA